MTSSYSLVPVVSYYELEFTDEKFCANS